MFRRTLWKLQQKMAESKKDKDGVIELPQNFSSNIDISLDDFDNVPKKEEEPKEKEEEKSQEENKEVSKNTENADDTNSTNTEEDKDKKEEE